MYRATAKEGNHLQIKKLTIFLSVKFVLVLVEHVVLPRRQWTDSKLEIQTFYYSAK